MYYISGESYREELMEGIIIASIAALLGALYGIWASNDPDLKKKDPKNED